MRIEKCKELMTVCYEAKRALQLLPSLPEGVTPAYVRYLDIMDSLQKRSERVKVSDLSDVLGLPRPGVTRTVKEMEQKGYLRKVSSSEDGRVTYLEFTEEGRKLSKAFNEQVFTQLSAALADVSDEDGDITIRTIETLYQIMSERRIHLEY